MKIPFGGVSLKIGASRRLAPTIMLVLMLFACGQHPTVTLALLGDLMLGRGVDPGLDSLTYLQPDLISADLALANLESPFASSGDQSALTPSSSVSPNAGNNLCALPDRAELLSAWGIDLLSIANNHNLDCNPKGTEDTFTILDHAGVTPIGPGMQPVYRAVNGLHLAFLAFDDVSSPLDESAALQAIRSARSSGNLVVISIHWGAEYQGGASRRQESLAGEFAEAGAALVWGHHPHVLQPAAWVKQSAGSEPPEGAMLVLYSLGNALFDQPGLQDTRQSALVMVTLDANGVISTRSVPFEIDVQNSRVTQSDAETTQKIRERLQLP
jgi:poly-gamma-glutamate synthesis protein (capsule biosynthesis protein)